MSKNGKPSFLNPFQGPISAKLEQAWSPGTETARLEFLNLMRMYAQQIPAGKGINAWVSFRDLVGNQFPGPKDPPEAVATLVVIAANAVASVCEQMEAALDNESPEAAGRRKAITEFFGGILDHAAQQRIEARLASYLNPGKPM
jgi:hypothetical protein